MVLTRNVGSDLRTSHPLCTTISDTSIHVQKYQNSAIHSIVAQIVNRSVNYRLLDPVFRVFLHAIKSWSLSIVAGACYCARQYSSDKVVYCNRGGWQFKSKWRRMHFPVHMSHGKITTLADRVLDRIDFCRLPVYTAIWNSFSVGLCNYDSYFSSKHILLLFPRDHIHKEPTSVTLSSSSILVDQPFFFPLFLSSISLLPTGNWWPLTAVTPQQALCFFLEPHGHVWFRPIFYKVARRSHTVSTIATHCALCDITNRTN